MQFRHEQLPNGLDIVAEVSEAAHSASLGFFDCECGAARVDRQLACGRGAGRSEGGGGCQHTGLGTALARAPDPRADGARGTDASECAHHISDGCASELRDGVLFPLCRAYGLAIIAVNPPPHEQRD